MRNAATAAVLVLTLAAGCFPDRIPPDADSPDSGTTGRSDAGSGGGHHSTFTEVEGFTEEFVAHPVRQLHPAVSDVSGGRVRFALAEGVSLEDVEIRIGGSPLLDVVIDPETRQLEGLTAASDAGVVDVELFTASGKSTLSQGFEYRHWTGLQLGIDESHVDAVVARPEHPDRLVVGTHGGLVYRSEDRGASWEVVGTGIEPIRYANLVGVPGEPDALLAICEDFRVCRSDDGAITWKKVLPARYQAEALFADPRGTVYATGDGLFAWTRDGGRHWSVREVAPSGLFNLFFDPRDEARVCAARCNIICTADRGLTWTLLPATGLPPTCPTNSLNAAAFSPSGTTMVVSSFDWLARSDDDGKTFTRVSPEGIYTRFNSVVALGDRFYAGYVMGSMVSEDDGLTWRQLYSGPSAAGDYLHLTETGELFATSNITSFGRIEGDAVTPLNQGLSAPDAALISRGQDGNLYASTSAGRYYASYDDGESWSKIFDTTPSYAQVVPLEASGGSRLIVAGWVRDPGSTHWSGFQLGGDVVYVAHADAITPGAGIASNNSGAVFLTTDGGETWSSRPLPTGACPPARFASRDTPSGPEYFAFTYCQVYRLPAGSAEWVAHGPAAPPVEWITDAVATVGGSVLFIAYWDGAYRMGPEATGWTKVDMEIPWYPQELRYFGEWIPFGIGAAPRGKDVVLLGTEGVVLESMDGGETWLSRRLPPGAWGNDFAFDPDDDKHVYGALGVRGFLQTRGRGGPR